MLSNKPCKFLFTTLPTNDLGLLTRSLPIAAELRNRGHSVVFSNPAQAPGKVIAAANFANLPPRHPLYEIGFSGLSFIRLLRLSRTPGFKEEYKGLLAFARELFRSLPLKKAKASQKVWDIDHAYALTGFLNFNFVKAQCLAYMKLIAIANVDVVVDFWNPFACIACKILGIPLITVNQGDALPGSKGFIWWKAKPRAIPSVVPILNQVLALFKINPINQCEELNQGDLTLVVGMPETDPLNTPHNYQYIGPVLWENPATELPSWFADLPADKAIIWLYPGNLRYGGLNKIFDSESMLRACYQAFDNPHYHVVLSLGHQILPSDLANPPPNFQCVDFVPGLSMAKRCDLMVHHGGYGSCQTGLVCGTPALILPTFSERESNARRIAAIGAGDFVAPTMDSQHRKTFDILEIRGKAEKLLADSRYRTQAAAYGQKLRGYGGVDMAAGLIESYTSSLKR